MAKSHKSRNWDKKRNKSRNMRGGVITDTSALAHDLTAFKEEGADTATIAAKYIMDNSPTQEGVGDHIETVEEAFVTAAAADDVDTDAALVILAKKLSLVPPAVVGDEAPPAVVGDEAPPAVVGDEAPPAVVGDGAPVGEMGEMEEMEEKKEGGKKNKKNKGKKGGKSQKRNKNKKGKQNNSKKRR